jgi:hypothetical protein
MTNENVEDYNDVLLDKIMELRSRPNHADGAIRFFAEAELNALNPELEAILLKKAQVLAVLELARLVNLMNQRPSY